MPSNKSHLIFLAISGVAMGMSWMFLYAAYQQIGVSIASLAYYCGPVIVMAMAPLIFKEKLTLVKVAGFAAVLFGLLLINFQAFREGKTTQGIMFGILSAIMYAVW
ncbi:MAG: EamA family transporter [Eubacteriales bacterium]|nr:EamA family transporter [Eubacteriales bacterium]